MSLEATNKKRIAEIPAGVHLVTILSMSRLLDSQKNQVIKDGEMAIIITFATGDNKRHEQVYWLGRGNEGKERYFTSMCLDAGVDMSKTPLSKKDVIGSRLWIAVREVFTLINGGEDVLKDITGKEIVEYVVFQTAPVFDPERAPTWKGDSAKNDGNAMDLFVGYKDEDGSPIIDAEDSNGSMTLVVEQATEENNPTAYTAKVSRLEEKQDIMPSFGSIPAKDFDFDGNPTRVNTAPSFDEPQPNFGDTDFPDDKF